MFLRSIALHLRSAFLSVWWDGVWKAYFIVLFCLHFTSRRLFPWLGMCFSETRTWKGETCNPGGWIKKQVGKSCSLLILKTDVREGSTADRMYLDRKLSSGNHWFVGLEMFHRNLSVFIKSSNRNGTILFLGQLVSQKPEAGNAGPLACPLGCEFET